jgi:hypothetical protein
MASDIAACIAKSVSLKYPLTRAGKVLLIPALQDAGQVSADTGTDSRGTARKGALVPN